MSSTIVISPPRPATLDAVDEPSTSADAGPSSPTPSGSGSAHDTLGLSHALSDFYRCGASHDEALLQQLQRCACEPYDAAAHLPLWRRLWARAALGPSEASCELPSAKWLQLGFQGDDPSVDLRGAGALGLRQLLHFCESGAGATVLAKHKAFPLAAASLSVTHMLASHLRLWQLPARGSSAAPPCADAVLREFLRLARSRRTLEHSNADAVLLMHEQLLRRLADRWVDQQLQPTRRTPMHFPPLLRELRSHLELTLASQPAPWELARILVALRDQRHSAATAALDGCPAAVQRAAAAALYFLATPTAWACPPLSPSAAERGG